MTHDSAESFDTQPMMTLSGRDTLRGDPGPKRVEARPPLMVAVAITRGFNYLSNVVRLIALRYTCGPSVGELPRLIARLATLIARGEDDPDDLARLVAELSFAERAWVLVTEALLDGRYTEILRGLECLGEAISRVGEAASRLQRPADALGHELSRCDADWLLSRVELPER